MPWVWAHSKGKQRCPKYGGEHRFEKCEEQIKCCDCGGQHSVTYGGCEVRKRAVGIQQVKTTNNISYGEAVQRIQGQKGIEVTDKSLRPRGGQREEANRLQNLTWIS